MIRCRLCGELVNLPCLAERKPKAEPEPRLVPFEDALPADAFSDDVVERRDVRRMPAPAVRAIGNVSSLEN